MTTALVRIPEVTYEREAYIDCYGHKHPAVTIKRRSYKKRIKKSKGKKKRTSKEVGGYTPRLRVDRGESITVVGERIDTLLPYSGKGKVVR